MSCEVHDRTNFGRRDEGVWRLPRIPKSLVVASYESLEADHAPDVFKRERA